MARQLPATMSSSGELGSEQQKETLPEETPLEAGRSKGGATGSGSSPAPAGGLSTRKAEASPGASSSKDNLQGASLADGKLSDRTRQGDDQNALTAKFASISVATGDDAKTDQNLESIRRTNVVASSVAAAGVHSQTGHRL